MPRGPKAGEAHPARRTPEVVGLSERSQTAVEHAIGTRLVETSPPPAIRTAHHLELFMGTRLGVATLLLGGALLLVLDDGRSLDAYTPRLLIGLIATMYAGSLALALWLRVEPARHHVAVAQLCADLVVTTGLVYVTGGPSSGFTFLYGVSVLMGAMVVGPLAARLAGISAIALYGVLSLGLSSGLIPPPADQRPEAYLLAPTDLFYIGLINFAGLLLVTVLASSLAARLASAGGQLQLAAASAARLARLNDDIVRSLSSGLLSTDLRGRILSINPTGLEMLGVKVDSVLGHSAADVLGIDLELLTGATHAALPGVTRAEADAQRGDGSFFPIGYSVSALLSSEGSSIGTLVLFQDLSEISRLRAIAAREERLAVLGRLSAGLAHEIRNPLSSISGSVQLVRDSEKLSDEERRLLGIVLTEVERLDDLVTTMLQVARPREPQRRMQDLRPLAQAIVDVAKQGLGRGQNLRIETSLPEVPVPAFVDGDQVRQVLWNLIKNAVQASPPGGLIRIEVAGTRDRATLSVSDEGEGITESQREKIYELFYSERTHGTGLGLALVRQIADAHQGTIDVISAHNHGATFIVSFRAQPTLARRSRDALAAIDPERA